jgi:hypothetical protein
LSRWVRIETQAACVGSHQRLDWVALDRLDGMVRLDAFQ